MTGAAIVGIGETEFSKCSGRSELQLAVEAISSALTDAGLGIGDIDGLVTFSIDANDPMVVANALQVDLRYFSCPPFGGAAGCAAVHDAALAVDAGLADVVIVYRALNERSGVRFGQLLGLLTERPELSYLAPFGLVTPAHLVSLTMHRYLHERALTNADLAPISVAARHHAATNPAAMFYERPVTLEEHQDAPWVVDPVLRLLDCCLETDGAVAVVVSRSDRVATANGVRVAAGARGIAAGAGMQHYSRPSIVGLPEMGIVAKELWRHSGLGPSDVQVAMFYDHFTPFVLAQLEAFGFAPPDGLRAFVADGGIQVGGRLPVNPHGGQLGEAYIHGMNGITEAVRQLRGTAANQVADVEHVLVTSGGATPASALVLSRS